MEWGKFALVVGVAASCAGCVTETKTMHLSPEMASNLKVKETEFPKREAKPETWVAVGDSFQDKMQYYKAAVTELEAKAQDGKATPAQQSAHAAEARRSYQSSMDSFDQACKAYQKALDIDPKCLPAYMHLANLYLSQDDPDRAGGVYQRALQLNPKSAALWHEQGMVQCKRKDLNAALPCLAKAYELEPSCHLFATQYGLCLARMGRPQEAVAVLATAMNKADANYNVAKMMAHISQPDMSKQYVQMALLERPTHTGALNLLGELNATTAGMTPMLGAPQFDSHIDRASYQTQR
jgi:tetratricopeptide (TPR) repeat protein